MKLKLIKNVENLKDYFVNAGFGNLIPQYQNIQPFQRIYVISKDFEDIGFVELHYLPKREDLLIARQVFENIFNTSENQEKLIELIEIKAKELGANVIFARLPEFMGLKYEEKGYRVLEKIYTLQKEI